MNYIWSFMTVFALQVTLEEGGDSTGEFISQIAGLIAVIVFAGAIWISMMVLLYRRWQERRRREREGLEPLPSLPTQVWQWWENRSKPNSSVRSVAAPRRTPSMSISTSDIPLPELDDLASDDYNIDDVLGAPPVVTSAASRGEIVSSPAAPPPPPPPTPAPIQDIPLQEPEVSTAMNYVPGSNQLPEDAVEVMRVWRDVTDGTLIIGMRDRLFATYAELDDDLGRRYRKLIQDLSRLATSTSAAPAIRRPIPAPTPPSSPSLQPATSGSSEPSAHVSIGEQIENLLQMRLMQAPELQGRKIHVRSGGRGAVLIEVDGEFYDSVGDIGDVVVRSFIQETIQQWEASQ